MSKSIDHCDKNMEESSKEVTSMDYMPKWKICRICLTSDIKLYNMKKYNIFLYYKQLSKIYEDFTEELPNYLCWDCATRTICAVHFKHQAIRSQTVLRLLSNTLLEEADNGPSMPQLLFQFQD